MKGVPFSNKRYAKGVPFLARRRVGLMVREVWVLAVYGRFATKVDSLHLKSFHYTSKVIYNQSSYEQLVNVKDLL